MITTRKKNAKKRQVLGTKSKKQEVLSVVSLRISDKEKERLDEIMKFGNFKNYSDVMRMAVKMVWTPNNETQKIEQYH